jgi:hypothetical protein
MDRDRFWTLVEETRGGNCRQHAARLTDRLRALGPTDIIAFQAVWDELMHESYRWDLWGAAYLANGGCSNDGFDYFRGWLVGQGREVFEAVLRDPDSLASQPRSTSRRPVWARLEPWDRLECEGMTAVAFWAYEAVTGQELPIPPRPHEPGAPSRRQPEGEDWDFDDPEEMRRRYPRL